MFNINFLITSFFLFWIGAAIGSFANVVIYRTGKKISWITGRSKCDECNKQIAWYDNVPLLSYLFLSGKTRCCKKQIRLIHPVLELLMGFLFAWWYFAGFVFFQLTMQPLHILQPMFWLVVGIILLIIFFIDYMHMTIPDLATGILLIITVLYRLALIGLKAMLWQDFVLSIIGATVMALFFYFLFWVTKGKGFGFGDVKLIFPLSLLMGWPEAIVGVFMSFILGAVMGIFLIVTKKKKMKSAVPFGPFLIVGCLIALIWGTKIAGWYIGLLY